MTGLPGKAPLLEAHGARIPAIGFGTSSIGGDCGSIVASALKLGYRHIDTAQKYGTERGVGEGIRASGVPRAEIFLTTKVSHEYLRPDDFQRSAEGSLKALGLDYVDLMLVHWPNAEIPLAGTMAALARTKREGLARHVGVANFNLELLDQAIALCPEPICNLQTEFHPYINPVKVHAGCRQRGIVLTGYCPLGRGQLLDDPVLAAIAAAKGKSPAQIALRWSLEHEGVAPLPRSSNPGRIAENLAVFDFALSDSEMARISALKRAGGKIADPKGRAPKWDD
jgi:2,5-diketo-D-gluconate reductase B